jgi:MFS family permease
VGGLITAIITLIGDYFEGEDRNRFMGLQAAFAGMGGLIFISLGGVLADVNWRMPFSLYIISLFVWFLALVSVYEPKHGKESNKEMETASDKIINIKIPSMVFLVYGITFFSALIFYMIPVQMPFMLNDMEGITNTKIGFAIAFVNVASVATSVNYGRIRRKISFQAIMAIVYFFVFVGFMIISQSGSYIMMIAGIIFAGLGFGLMLPNINLWLISLAPAPMRGRLVGYLNMSLFLGMFGSPIVIQPLVVFSNLYFTFFLVGLLLLVMAIAFFFFTILRKSS